MNHHALFIALADSYPATSTWMIGPSEPMEWCDICGYAMWDACAAPGCDVTGDASEQAEYWREAHRVLEEAEGVMVSVEVEVMAAV